MTDLPESTSPDGAEPVLQRLRGASDSDDAVLNASYEAHRAELFAFLLRMTRDREMAEDLLQDAFVRLIKEVRSGRKPEMVRPWLYRVAFNDAVSRSRRSSTLLRLMPRLVDRREPVRPDGDVLRAERDTELHAALADLHADARAALLLAADGFTGREIAGLIGKTEGATRTLLSRARVQVRLVLEAGEGRA